MSVSHPDITGKTILITGGTGSFGRTFIQLLLPLNPKKIIVFSRDEWKQWEMQQSPEFQSDKLRFFLGDIRDAARLKRAFKGVDVVVHAAALKQVPAAEYNPDEFVKTNIQGSIHIIDAAIDCGVKKVLALSTDKAVSPVNLYGATKLCAEKLFTGANVYRHEPDRPLFSVVRYGNVLLSRGSVTPFWQEMIKSGAEELPITDLEMTRFWITLSDAVDYVIDCLAQMLGGEIFVPNLKSMYIKDLAEVLKPGIKLKVTGIRPGEKINETLIGIEESRLTYKVQNGYVVLPTAIGSDYFESTRRYWTQYGQAVDENFVFASNCNCEYVPIETMKELLDQNQSLETVK